jgi:hypothetical protein
LIKKYAHWVVEEWCSNSAESISEREKKGEKGICMMDMMAPQKRFAILFFVIRIPVLLSGELILKFRRMLSQGPKVKAKVSFNMMVFILVSSSTAC